MQAAPLTCKGAVGTMLGIGIRVGLPFLECKVGGCTSDTESDLDTPLTAIPSTSIWGRLASDCETWVSELTVCDTREGGEDAQPTENVAQLEELVFQGSDSEDHRELDGATSVAQETPQKSSACEMALSLIDGEQQLKPEMEPEMQPEMDLAQVGESLWDLSEEHTLALGMDDSMPTEWTISGQAMLSLVFGRDSCGSRPTWEATVL